MLANPDLSIDKPFFTVLELLRCPSGALIQAPISRKYDGAHASDER